MESSSFGCSGVDSSLKVESAREITIRNIPGMAILVPVRLANSSVMAVVDTGAEATVVSSELADRLGISYLNCSTTSIKMADRDATRLKAYVVPNCPLRIGTQDISWDLIIADIGEDILLGLDFLCGNAGIMDFHNARLSLNGEWIDGKHRPSKTNTFSVSSVSTLSEVMIPANSAMFIEVKLNDLDTTNVADAELLIEPHNTSLDLLFPNALAKTSSPMTINVVNLSSKPIKLPKDKIVATASICDILPDFSDPSSSDVLPTSEESLTSNSFNVGQISHDNPSELNPMSDESNDESTNWDNILAEISGAMPKHLEDLFKRSCEGLTVEQCTRLGQLLMSFEDIFAKHDLDLGCFTEIKHDIDTGDHAPVRHKLRRTPFSFQSEEENHLAKLLDLGVIRPSNSAWASAPVLIRKKDGSVRWCIDYRDLNAKTVKDSFPLPNIQDCLDTLSGSVFFSTLDMASGYYQIELEESAKPKTAIITRYGLFEHNRMGFGLCNAPATFQRAIQLVLMGLTWKQALAYLDDVNVLGKDFDDHLRNLEEVFLRFRRYHLKFKPKKCFLFRRQVKFLGKLCTPEGLNITPDKVEAVKNWQRPKNTKEVESFLGFANYHREHIRGFANLTKCLYDLTGKQKFFWSEEQEEAFVRMKELLISAPCLAYPRPEGMFILDTDASKYTIGAELSQVQDGVVRPIAYASNILLPAHRKYCTTRKELLAIIKFTDQFRHYLLGRHFTVRTDHHSLVWLFRFRKLEGQLARWQEQLAQFDFQIVHRPGGKHSNADGLSRLPNNLPPCDCYNAGKKLQDLPCKGCKFCTKAHEQWERFCEDVDDVIPLAVKTLSLTKPSSLSPTPTSSSSSPVLADAPPVQAEIGPVALAKAKEIQSNWLEAYSSVQLRDLQLQDPDLKSIIGWLENKEIPLKNVLFLSSAITKSLWLVRLQLRLINGVLYHLWKTQPDCRVCLVVPRKLRKDIMNACHAHRTAGHLGQNKTYSRVRSSFMWPGMTEEINLHVKCCSVCAKNKSPSNPPRAGLREYHSGFPLERVHIDVLGPFTKSALGNKYILMMVDQFTKWVDCAAIPDQKAETVALKFTDYFMSPLGPPLSIHTDQGSNFESGLFQAFCEQFQIAKTRTTPYHPSSNGQVERYNRVLLPMIRSYIEGKQAYWDKDLSLLVMALHATVNRQTGFTPNRLMLGREVFQPIDILMGTASLNITPSSPNQWAKDMRLSLEECHQLVRQRMRSAQKTQKRNYDARKLRELAYHVGDIVLKRDEATKVGYSTKLRSPYSGPYLVAEAEPPVYTIVGARKRMTVHHDKLLPFLSEEIPYWLRRKRHSLFNEELRLDESGSAGLDETLGLANLLDSGHENSEESPTASVSDEIPSLSESGEISGNADVDSESILYPCGICAQNVTEDDDAICCDGLHCAKWFHRRCSGLSQNEFESYTQENSPDWLCHDCKHVNLPYNFLESDDLPNLFSTATSPDPTDPIPESSSSRDPSSPRSRRTRRLPTRLQDYIVNDT